MSLRRQAEFQAVVLALGNEDERISVMTEKIPRALLPIGNRPLLFYQLFALERSGFEEVILVAPKRNESRILAYATEVHANDPLISKFRDSVELSAPLSVRTVVVEDDAETADALREICPMIRNDVIILHDDLIITELALFAGADVHRAMDASLTMLLFPSPRADGKESKHKGESEIIDLFALGGSNGGFMPAQLQRVLLFSPEVDADDSFHISGASLEFFPEMELRPNVRDSHLYVLSRWALGHLVEEKSMQSLGNDFIPHLIRKQFILGHKLKGNDRGEEEPPATTKKSSSRGLCSTAEDPIVCNGRLFEDEYVRRLDTVPDFVELNKSIVSGALAYVDDLRSRDTLELGEKSTMSGDCSVGSNVRIGERSTVKKSIIGDHTSIGSEVKLSNCIIMDHVHVGDGCTIVGGVIGSNAHIGEKTSLKDCIVAPTVNVTANQDLKVEAIRS